MTPAPGIEPGTHWWEASAVTTAPSLLLLCNNSRILIEDQPVFSNPYLKLRLYILNNWEHNTFLSLDELTRKVNINIPFIISTISVL